ncbi:hypothetical protein [Vibrio rotiferianus]|uniref:hypothetical protein n=1 Tax=Vibrio rotiferianus TaxID=190895 RepID=UPI00390A1BB6
MEDLRINERLYTLSLSDQDLSRLTASLNKIRTERAEGQSDKEYSLGITIVNGGFRSEQPIKSAPVYLYLQPSENIGMFKVLDDFNLASQDLSPYKNVQDWIDCGANQTTTASKGITGRIGCVIILIRSLL